MNKLASTQKYEIKHTSAKWLATSRYYENMQIYYGSEDRDRARGEGAPSSRTEDFLLGEVTFTKIFAIALSVS